MNKTSNKKNHEGTVESSGHLIKSSYWADLTLQRTVQTPILDICFLLYRTRSGVPYREYKYLVVLNYNISSSVAIYWQMLNSPSIAIYIPSIQKVCCFFRKFFILSGSEVSDLKTRFISRFRFRFVSFFHMLK